MPPLKKFLIGTAALGVLTILFPWFLAYKGTILGMPVSVRAIGDPLGVVCILIGAAILFSKSFQEKTKSIGFALDNLEPAAQWKIIFGATALYALAVISHKLRAQYMIGTHAFDLGFFSNICWNTVQGDWFYSSILERNFMGVHVNWILWPLAYFYKLYRGAQVLLVAQAVFVAAAIPVLWHTVRKITGSFAAGFVASLLYVASPYIGHTVSNDFHPDVWLLPCLFLSVAAWLDKRPVQLVAFGLLALLAKEDVSVVLCGFGLMLMFQKNWRLTGAALFLSSLGIFYLHTHVVTPRYLEGQTSILFSRYAFLGDDFKEMAMNLIFKPSVYLQAIFYEPTKYWRFFSYFLPVAGLTLLSPLFLIPPFISALPHLLSQASTQLELADIYSMPAQAFIFIGAALGAMKLLERYGKHRALPLTGLLFLVAGAGVLNAPRYYRADSKERIRAFHEMKKLVPPEASVAAQQNILPHFDTRRFIQMFPIKISMHGLQTKYLENPDYIACDRIGNALPWNEVVLADEISTLEKNPAYEKIYEQQNFMLFHRRDGEEPRWKTP